MKFIKNLDKVESGAAQVSLYAYLVFTDDIEEWFPPEKEKVTVNSFPVMKQYSYFYRLYITRNSQKYSVEIVGNHDERGFKQKFTGTHPGRSVSVLEFIKKYLDAPFIIFIPECDGSTVILGTPDNPMTMVSTHENSTSGRKFTFNFEQEIAGDDPYLIGFFRIDEDAVNIDIKDNFSWVLADTATHPIIYPDNKILQLYPH